MLLALGREDIMLGYRNPRWMTAAGVLVTVATLWMGLTTLWRMVQG
jgi:Mn2+/Fe2+ NRAMP family transporter